MSGRREALQASIGQMSIPEHRYPERVFVRVPLMLSCKTKVCVGNRLESHTGTFPTRSAGGRTKLRASHSAGSADEK